MREIRMSGLTSGDGKRSVAAWPTPPRPSSTLQIKGKKRHILVDTQGLLMHAIVHAADAQDRDGGIWENLNRRALAFLRLASIRLMLRKLCNVAAGRGAGREL